MIRWVRRLVPFVIVGLLLWQPVWLLVALLAPGAAIVESASALALPFTPERVGHATGSRHYGIPFTDIAIGSVPLAAVGFWAVTLLAWLMVRSRNRRKSLGHGAGL